MGGTTSGARAKTRVISLGGTIAMTRGANGVVPTLDAHELIEAVPGIAAIADLSTEALRQTSSSNLDLLDVLALRKRVDIARTQGCVACVVTQGTDTLEETAFMAELVHEGSETLVFTGAMRHPSSPGADGPANLLDAVRVAVSPLVIGAGVLVVMNGQIHGARFVRKAHTSALDAFHSSPVGPLGEIVEGAVRMYATPRPHLPKLRVGDLTSVPYVGLYATFGGDDGRTLSAFDRADVAGLVIETLGAGHVPEKLLPMLSDLAGRRPVVYSSRASHGALFTNTYGYAGGEVDLLSRGLICAGSLATAKARVLLEALLAGGYDRAGIEGYFKRIVEGSV